MNKPPGALTIDALSMAAGKDKVAKLCAYYTKNRTAYSADGVKEAQVRLALIDPLFVALGWDVKNEGLVAPQYREVIPEENLDVDGKQRAPDYAFRVGTLTKFYAEAKKCSVNITADPSHAFQLRRYGWSGKTAASILTNFSELSVYDCTKKPSPSEKASHSRLLHFKFEEYPDRWQELWDLFSREAIWSGGFDEFAASKRRRGTAEVDVQFLKEIEGWREAIAKNFALRNHALAVDDLNTAVQMLIDRVIFLRMAEDRGLEPFGQLLTLSAQPQIYKRFIADLCRRADEKYNSGLFHFEDEADQPEKPDRLSSKLALDDKAIKPVLQSLYFEHGSPYDFGILPVEILGTVYERFLGKVIRLTAGHQAKVEEKPAVRKAGGVFYTPAYVVDYIVQSTVALAITGKSPAQLSGTGRRPVPFRIVDMACGSGSFLLGAYRVLSDHCLAWYLDHSPARHKKAVLRNPKTGQWQLTIEEKKRLLLTHIYGVDIDRQAVEVTKLSLLLKALEGESDLTLSEQLKLFGERALPNLFRNIRCGNSLVSPEYFENDDIQHDQLKEINAFSWEKEFPSVTSSGGWDIIIGNPPYVQIENIPRDQREYFIKKFGSNGSLGKRYDLYQVFVLRALELLKNEGRMGYITPNTFLTGRSYEMLRERITTGFKILQIADLPQGVFEGVTVDNVIFTIQRQDDSAICAANKIAVYKLNPRSLKTRLTSAKWDDTFTLSQSDVVRDPSRVINIQANPKAKTFLKRIGRGCSPLGDLTESSQGIILYETEAEAETSSHTGSAAKPGWKKLLRGTNISRYAIAWDNEYVHYGRWLWRAREEKFFTQPKILLQAMRNKSLKRRLVATFDSDSYYNAHNLANIIAKPDSPYSLLYLLGIFNSKLINFLVQKHFPNVNINPGDFSRIPIRTIDFGKTSQRSAHDAIASAVQRLLRLNTSLQAAASEIHRLAISKQIAAQDESLDLLIYELYEVSQSEKNLIDAET